MYSEPPLGLMNYWCPVSPDINKDGFMLYKTAAVSDNR